MLIMSRYFEMRRKSHFTVEILHSQTFQSCGTVVVVITSNVAGTVKNGLSYIQA